jgi:hypothetical protein
MTEQELREENARLREALTSLLRLWNDPYLHEKMRNIVHAALKEKRMNKTVWLVVPTYGSYSAIAFWDQGCAKSYANLRGGPSLFTVVKFKAVVPRTPRKKTK